MKPSNISQLRIRRQHLRQILHNCWKANVGAMKFDCMQITRIINNQAKLKYPIFPII